MQCMEIWGGNRTIDQSFEAPGLNLHVHSRPYRSSKSGGGDIYYLTSCASGRITRLLLADVSGHGQAAASLAVSLRDLLRTNVNTISQERFIEEMNREFGRVAEQRCFATAVVATFFEPRNNLSLGLAGHPYPIYYRAARDQWVHVDSRDLEGNRLGNLPLGVHKESNYPGRDIRIERGDMFLLYSDAFIEAVDRDQQPLGIPGIVELLNSRSRPHADQVIPELCESVRSLSDANLQDDDATLILGEFTSSRVRLRDNLLAPFRLLGRVQDKTRLE